MEDLYGKILVRREEKVLAGKACISVGKNDPCNSFVGFMKKKCVLEKKYLNLKTLFLFFPGELEEIFFKKIQIH